MATKDTNFTKGPIHKIFRLLSRLSRTAFSTILAALLTLSAEAASPDGALVVVNADSWASTAVANEYIAARGIPAANVVYLRDLPSFEKISVQDFREKILSPVLKTAELRGISGQIDCVLYSSDFPTAVDVSADMAGKQFPKTITQPASITGLTYFYQLTLGKNPGYLGTNTNFYFRQIARTTDEPKWPDLDTQKYTAAIKTLQEAGAAREKSRQPDGTYPALPAATAAQLRDARDAMLALKPAHSKNTELLYNLACAQSLSGNDDAALAILREALAAGWWDMAHASRDTDLRTLHTRPDFKELAAQAKLTKFDLWPTSGFRGPLAWQPNGAPAAADKGMRYLLSTTLAHTSGRGLSVPESIANLRRSIAADGTHPRGTFYFMQNGDVRSTTREWAFERAAEKLREIGHTAIVEKGVLPAGKNDIAGAVIGIADFDWAKSGSAILPGAICEHLTSFGGMLNEGASQTPLTEFLRAGAAGASGTVTEPYAIQAKFPTPFIHWHYARGCTLAESYYQSIAAPYQLLITGDALCAPWRKRLTTTVDGIAAGAELKGIITLKPTATSPDGITAAAFDLMLDGRRVARAKAGDPLTFNTAISPDGPHTLTVVADGADPLGSTSRAAFPVTIRNTPRAATFTAPTGDWPWNRPLEIKATAEGADAVAIFHNARPVAKLNTPSGLLKLNPRDLGQGPVTLQPIAIFGKTETWAQPITLNIVPPPPLAAQPLAAGQKLEPGLRVTVPGLPSKIADPATDGWLAKAGVAKDGEFTVDAWFTIPADEVVQFQLHGPRTLKLTVNGEPCEWSRGKEWWFIPIHLARGPHRMRIEGKADGDPALDIRFGARGTRRLSADLFQHPEAN